MKMNIGREDEDEPELEGAATESGKEDIDDGSEDAEEDAWLALAMAADEMDDVDAVHGKGERYLAKFMDTDEMQTLRRSLRDTTARLASDGHLREYVPRRPVAATVRVGIRHRHHHRSKQAYPASGHFVAIQKGAPQTQPEVNTSNQKAPLSARPARKVDYSHALRLELQQVKELRARYEDTKRALLDHVDEVCTTKPSERGVGNAHDTYERLDELVAFANHCSVGM